MIEPHKTEGAFKIVDPPTWEFCATLAAKKFHGWIHRISYKPSVELHWQIRRDPSGGRFGYIVLGFVHYTIDSDNFRNLAEITHRSEFTFEMIDHMSFEDFKHLIYRTFERMEIHEAGEFFKVDGIKIYDPHKNEKEI